jgi:hypothetical protein
MANGGIRGYGTVEGLDELIAQIERVSKIPKRALSKAAREGMRKPLAQARKDAPEESGALKKGIKSVLEKSSKRSKFKSIYQMVFDKKKTEIFKGKKIIRQGLYGANPPKEYGFYPVSMEYGYLVKGGRREGKHFLAKAIEDNQDESAKIVVRVLTEEIDRAIGGNLP